jgi:protein-L-isoaspartate(D-aspartate) O-methyltransferase
MALVDSLIKDGWLKTTEIIDAFRKVKRVDFLPEDIKDLAELNEALPIGYGQTISQPLVVAFMLELLKPKKGDKILDVGSGSGWTTALLSHIVGLEGKVIALEIVSKLKDFGEENVAKYSFIEKGVAEFFNIDGSKGYPEISKGFDAILASASAQKIPDIWKRQLKIKGRIVAPVKSSIWLIIKEAEKDFEKREYPGFSFVPLIS